MMPVQHQWTSTDQQCPDYLRHDKAPPHKANPPRPWMNRSGTRRCTLDHVSSFRCRRATAVPDGLSASIYRNTRTERGNRGTLRAISSIQDLPRPTLSRLFRSPAIDTSVLSPSSFSIVTSRFSPRDEEVGSTNRHPDPDAGIRE